MDINNTKRFIVVKFINENEDCDEEDDTLFEVGLAKWLQEKFDDEMVTKIAWPPRSEQSIALKKELDAHPSWPIYNVVVLQFYDTLLEARHARNGYIISSNYETEYEFGRGKRKKIKRQLSSDESTNVTKKRLKNISTSDDSNSDNSDRQEFRSKQSAPSPPLISFQPQNNKVEKNTKGTKISKVELLHKNNKLEKRNDTILTYKNTKSKENLFTKKHQAKKETSAAIDKKETSVMIETARQKCLIENKRNTGPDATEKSLGTPSTSKSSCTTYKHDIFNKKSSSPSSPMRDVYQSEIRNMSPITSHVAALVSTPSSHRSSDSVSNRSEVAFDTNKAFDKKMYQEISSKLDVVIMNQCKLNRYLLPHEKRIVRPADLPALPLTTKEELKKFEKYLLKDDNLGATICYMSQVIGPKDNTKEATYKVLKKLISNTLASEFTLKGNKNLSKNCFDKLALYEVVQGSILDKRPEAEIPNIAEATSLWLKQAPWRRQDDGSMGRRTKK